MSKFINVLKRHILKFPIVIEGNFVIFKAPLTFHKWSHKWVSQKCFKILSILIKKRLILNFFLKVS